MKKLTLLFALAASFSLAACSEDKHEHVVHDTRVVHHYHSRDQVNVPSNNSNDFEPVERPSTYSR